MRKWRASLVRKRARVLGDAEALTRQDAEAAAINKFNLGAEQQAPGAGFRRWGNLSRHHTSRGPSSGLPCLT